MPKRRKQRAAVEEDSESHKDTLRRMSEEFAKLLDREIRFSRCLTIEKDNTTVETTSASVLQKEIELKNMEIELMKRELALKEKERANFSKTTFSIIVTLKGRCPNFVVRMATCWKSGYRTLKMPKHPFGRQG